LVHVASSAEGALAQLAEVEAVRLVAAGAYGLPCVKRSLRSSFFVAVGALDGDLSDALGVRFVTRDARSLAFHWMRRAHLRMAFAAGLNGRRAHCVWFVATATVTMRASGVLS
jgi:hypothetical protein